MRLDAFDRRIAAAQTAEDVWAAVMALFRAHLPAKLFTIMTVDLDAMVARRAFTSHPTDYPTSGTKEITPNPWFETVVVRGEVFTAQTLSEIAEVFPDHALIGSLGCASVLNLPLRREGKIAATVNILDLEGSYPQAAVETALRLREQAEAALRRAAQMER